MMKYAPPIIRGYIGSLALLRRAGFSTTGHPRVSVKPVRVSPCNPHEKLDVGEFSWVCMVCGQAVLSSGISLPPAVDGFAWYIGEAEVGRAHADPFVVSSALLQPY